MPVQLDVRLVLGPVLALQRHLLAGLDLFALDLARVDFRTNLSNKNAHNKAHSNVGMHVDVALESSGIVLSSVDLPIPETDSYSEPASEQSSPRRDRHYHHVGHADLDRNGHASIDRVHGVRGQRSQAEQMHTLWLCRGEKSAIGSRVRARAMRRCVIGIDT